MYNNVMTKFKFGNYKHARYLDHESTTMFFPVMMSTFYTLSQNLIKEGHPDLAAKALRKYDDMMPTNLNVDVDVENNKYLLAKTAYQANDSALGAKFITAVDNYLVQQLDYNYYLLQKNSSLLSPRTVALSLQTIEKMIGLTTAAHQTSLTNKLQAQSKNYEAKFGSFLNSLETNK